MTTTVEVTWKDEQVLRVTRTLMRKRMNRAGGIIKDILQDKVSARRVSQPGQPPGRVSGRLYRSFRTETRSAFGRKGGPLLLRIRIRDPKAHLLERGTKKMKARPFFVGTVVTFGKGRWMQILAGRG